MNIDLETLRSQHGAETEEDKQDNIIAESIELINDVGDECDQNNTVELRKKRKRWDDDKLCNFKIKIPKFKRKSARLLNFPPEFTYTDLLDFEDIEMPSCDYDLQDIENVLYKPRHKQIRRSNVMEIVSVESITTEYMANIATKSTKKVYSKSGTSCHQCRQKTLDSKTFCRSGSCVGVRGQFCGVCLLIRYGEDASEALMDPKWECPPCRGVCNCSICRSRDGKRPTGILAPLAFRNGHKSVLDFLVSLKGLGDAKEEENHNYGNTDKSLAPNSIVYNQEHISVTPGIQSTNNDCEDFELLGFNKNGSPVFRIM